MGIFFGNSMLLAAVVGMGLMISSFVITFVGDTSEFITGFEMGVSEEVTTLQIMI